MKQCVFVGPSLPLDHVPTGYDVYGPASMGAVYLAAEEGYERIVLVDGCLGMTPAVWHKEILFAISKNIEVVGTATIGAVRAAELKCYGMLGYGLVYNLLQRGILTDDDEVVVDHGRLQDEFSRVSESMVSIRYFVNALRKDSHISSELAGRTIEYAKGTFFPQRTQARVVDFLRDCGSLKDAQDYMDQRFVDVARRDAEKALKRFRNRPVRQTKNRLWRFPATEYWSSQVNGMRTDIPPLSLRRMA